MPVFFTGRPRMGRGRRRSAGTPRESRRGCRACGYGPPSRPSSHRQQRLVGATAVRRLAPGRWPHDSPGIDSAAGSRRALARTRGTGQAGAHARPTLTMQPRRAATFPPAGTLSTTALARRHWCNWSSRRTLGTAGTARRRVRPTSAYAATRQPVWPHAALRVHAVWPHAALHAHADTPHGGPARLRARPAPTGATHHAYPGNLDTNRGRDAGHRIAGRKATVAAGATSPTAAHQMRDPDTACSRTAVEHVAAQTFPRSARIASHPSRRPNRSANIPPSHRLAQ